MPINFTCPHCGNSTEVADQYAGQSGPCAQCGRTITVPAPGAAAIQPGMAYAPPAKQSSSTPVVVIVLVTAVGVLIMCSGILIALLLPAIQAAREAARRAQCLNNMKQVGLAMHMYHDEHGSFPPAYVADENGKPMHSWRVLLLPYMEQSFLYEQYNMDEPWDSPENLALADMISNVYRCPSSGSENPTETSYVMLVGPDAISDGPTGRKIAEIWDGTSNTIMIVEVSRSGINWLEPRDLNISEITFRVNDFSGREISSEHHGVANVVFCDGSVHSIPEDIDPQTLRAMSTIAGGEDVGLPFDDF